MGFTEMGEINDEMKKFGRLCVSEVETEMEKESKSAGNKEKDLGERERHLAKYVIVFLVRALFTKLCYPFGHFASEGFTSDQIFPCAHEAIRILESIGCKVRAITADGASPNRKYFKLHRMDGGENNEHGVTYWSWNLWCPTRKI